MSLTVLSDPISGFRNMDVSDEERSIILQWRKIRKRGQLIVGKINGQLDNCDLTLREVRAVEDAIIRTVCSVYHGRIAYPEAPKTDKATEKHTGSSQQIKTKSAPAQARTAS